MEIKYLFENEYSEIKILNFNSPDYYVTDEYFFDPELSGYPDIQILRGFYFFFINEYKKALFWFSQAAKFEMLIAKFYSALCNYKIKDYENALSWAIDCINDNYIGIYHLIGQIYMLGYNDERNGIKWIIRDAERGNVLSQTMCGLYYQKNKSELANYYYKLAAENGCSTAQNNYGTILLDENKKEEAIFWLLKSAKQGNKIAQKNCFIFYSFYNNFKETLFWYKTLHSNNLFDLKVQCILGKLYLTNGMTSEAETCFLDAAEKGCKESIIILGLRNCCK